MRRCRWQRWKGNKGSGRERIWRERHKTKAKDTVAVNTIETNPNTPLSYALGSEHHCPNMIRIEDHGGQLERVRKS